MLEGTGALKGGRIMHNRYFVEVYDGKEWRAVSRYRLYFYYEDAVDAAKTLWGDGHKRVRVVDECYGRTQWESEKGE